MLRTILTSVDGSLAPKDAEDADPAHLPYVPPETLPSHPDLDVLLAREMCSLTVEERNDAEHDVHAAHL